MNILHISYPILISVIIGVTNIIPFFGPFIGAIPSTILLFMDSPKSALIFIIMIIVLQQFDGNILGPKILGSSTGLSGFWVIFAIMFFGGLWGPGGMIIGIPFFAVIYAMIKRSVDRKLKAKNLPILESSVTLIPQTYVKLEGENAEHMLKLLDELEEHDDVKDVYSNFDISKEDMEKYSE